LHRIVKRKLVIGGAALAVAAFAGGAYAATQNSGPNTRQAFLNDVAKRLHVSPQQLSSALNGAFLDQLQAAVQDGRLTQSQANALEQRLKRKGTAPVLPFGYFGFGPRRLGGPLGGSPGGPLGGPPGGPRGGLPGGPRGGLPGGPPRAFGGVGALAGPGALQAAASYLGLTDAQLFQQLSSGKSLAGVAGSKGKSVSGLEQAMTNAVKARLDKLVSAKVMTAAQEQKLLSRLSTRLSAEINRKGLPLRKALRRHLHIPRGGVPAPNAPVPPAYAPVPPAYSPAPDGLPAPTA
jgi:AraC-like DNA-binding protein